ncbi:hypothetical protein PAPYR_7657 [Paratrimastix pyriformis]|uniref:Uncharacterized protein n=1 Tax=Paratrimastix pyriformis TaxID=342808 RepID=A0ABQ8UE07_9EUKA|nr:hypothetical protein PAPYR_7657 [Paratrimastix pyriformis]
MFADMAPRRSGSKDANVQIKSRIISPYPGVEFRATLCSLTRSGDVHESWVLPLVRLQPDEGGVFIFVWKCRRDGPTRAGPSLCTNEGHLAGGRDDDRTEYRPARILVQAVREGDISRAYTRFEALACSVCEKRITTEEWWHCNQCDRFDLCDHRAAHPPDHKPDHPMTRSCIERCRPILTQQLDQEMVAAVVGNGPERPYPVLFGDPLITVEPFYERRYNRWELNKLEVRLSKEKLREAIEGRPGRTDPGGKGGCAIM